MKKYPKAITLESLCNNIKGVSTEIDGKWVPARGLGYASLGSRFRCAWMVFTGKADALTWPGGK